MKQLCISLFLFSSVLSYGQIKKGEAAFADMRYADAIYHYEIAAKKEQLPPQAIQQLADACFKTQQYDKALQYYTQLKTPPRIRYGQLLAMHRRYREAAAQYKLNEIQDDQLKATIALYEEGVKSLYKDSASCHTKLLNINSGYADFCPVSYGAGLVFVSDRPNAKVFKAVNGWTGGNFLSIYRIADTARVKDASLRNAELEQVLDYAPGNKRRGYANPESSNDSRPISADPKPNYKPVPNQLSAEMVTPFDSRLNQKYHEGPVAFSKNLDTIIITYNNKEGRLKLRSLVSHHGEWSSPVEFPYNSNSYSVGQPSLHPNGNVLFFTSDMPGGKGGKDIYYCLREGNKWGRPINAGPNVNTSGDEMFPYITATNMLYFSSDKWPGLGGLDIFSVSLDTAFAAVTTPQNAGAPMNSPRNDFGLLLEPSGMKGYFSSDRRGNDDIYLYLKSYPH